MDSYKFLRPLFFKFSPEVAHRIALESLRLKALFSKASDPVYNKHPVKLMGLDLPNPIGLAAGLDKNGEYVSSLASLGFGHIEVGTVTPRPQPGNPKPRLHRLIEEEALINRMGFNNKGIDHLIHQVKKSNYTGILGINIGKNATTPIEHATDDYLIGLEKAYPYASYITVNISSPNTANLRDLQNGTALIELLSRLKEKQLQLETQVGKYVPLAVKIAPDLTIEELASVANTLISCEIDGVIATNTALDRSGLKERKIKDTENLQGGLSGKPIAAKSDRALQELHKILANRIAVIGCGGIDSYQRVVDKMNLGAQAVQIYTGLIYKGPSLIKEILNDL